MQGENGEKTMLLENNSSGWSRRVYVSVSICQNSLTQKACYFLFTDSLNSI